MGQRTQHNTREKKIAEQKRRENFRAGITLKVSSTIFQIIKHLDLNKKHSQRLYHKCLAKYPQLPYSRFTLTYLTHASDHGLTHENDRDLKGTVINITLMVTGKLSAQS